VTKSHAALTLVICATANLLATIKLLLRQGASRRLVLEPPFSSRTSAARIFASHDTFEIRLHDMRPTGQHNVSAVPSRTLAVCPRRPSREGLCSAARVASRGTPRLLDVETSIIKSTCIAVDNFRRLTARGLKLNEATSLRKCIRPFSGESLSGPR
jgi:hypothetical protein